MWNTHNVMCNDVKGFMLITHSKSNGSGNKI